MFCVAVNCHFVKVTTCTCCDKLIRTGFLVNAMESLEYFQSAMLRCLSAYNRLFVKREEVSLVKKLQ